MDLGYQRLDWPVAKVYISAIPAGFPAMEDSQGAWKLKARHRLRLIVSGRVQGVGFRYFTCRLAEEFDVTGYVRNLPNGDVEIVAEGAQAVVEEFMARAGKGPSYSRVKEVKSYLEPPEGKYDSFGISR